METLEGEVWDADVVHLNNRNLSRLTPETPFCPVMVKLFLQENQGLTTIPPSFFEHMPALRLLDLSRTSVQSLPPSISKLSLLEELILQECTLLMELPPEIGTLKNLKLFDLEGTEIMYLPEEMGKLEDLECLRVSLCAYADEYKDRNGIDNIIPRTMISKVGKLKELSISVNPDAEWWEAEVSEAILENLYLLPCLKTLKLYLPTAKELHSFLRLESCQLPIYSSLRNFRLIIGHSEQLTSCLPFDLVDNFEKLEKCLKYVNGEGSTGDIAELIRNAKALFLCRHWTIEKLSIFDISRLEYCLLAECNEMHTIVNAFELYEDKNIANDNGGKDVFGSLQYLAIHFMKKLQSIWKGPIARDSLLCLRILALHTCPELTTIFTECMLDNLHSLTEIIVEDCPKVSSLVSMGSTPWRYGPFLPNLRRVLLLDLPELISISSGVCIAPRLDTLLIFNCMKLDHLSVMELPRDVKEIQGEIEWWDALKYGPVAWWRAFVPLKRDGDLIDRLAGDTNSLKHFHKLQKISPRQCEASSVSCSTFVPSDSQPLPAQLSRYVSQKHRHWKIFRHYLKNQRPPVALSHCNSGHVIEFLKYLDQFGKTKVHMQGCVFFGHPYPAATCFCPLRQAWGTLDVLIGRLHAAYEENIGLPEMNPFATRAIQFYLSQVRESQEKASGMPYKNKRNSPIFKVKEEKSDFGCSSHIMISHKKGKDDAKKPFNSTRQRQSPDVEAAQTIIKEKRTLLSSGVGDFSSGTINSESQGFSSSGASTERCSKLIEPPKEMKSSDGQGSSSAGTGIDAFRKLSEPPQQAIDIILFWGSTAERKIYVFDTHRKEIDQYLGAVDKIQSWLNYAAASDDLSKVKSTMQLAMSRLMEEFRTILQVMAKSKEHVSSVDPSSTTFRVTMTQGVSSNYEVQEDDYVKSDTMSPEVVSDLRSVAVRTNAAGYLHDCVEVYICERKPIMQSRFKQFNIQKLSRYSAQRLEWGVLESMIEVWIKSANICFKYLFASEKQLCEQIFKGLGKNTEDVCFVVTVQDYAIELLDMADALSFIRPAPDKLFRILELYETLSGLLPQINKLFHTQSKFFGTKAATRMIPRLADKIKKIVSEFEKALVDQQSLVIFVGPIHPLPRYVMSYLYKLCDHKHTLMGLSLSKLPSIDGVDLELKGQSELSHHVVWIIMMLVSNLESRAKLCEDGSAGHFFAMKNIHYIVQKIGGWPALMEVVGDDYFGKLIQKVNQAKVKYLISELEKIRERRDY